VRKISAALVAAGVLAVYLLRLDRAAGLIIDDAWYILLARTLAEGRGFFLVSSPTAPILPSAPVGFPLMLSFVFRLNPLFPQNLWMLKAVSIRCRRSWRSSRAFARRTPPTGGG
jgi:hypothetical protein